MSSLVMGLNQANESELLAKFASDSADRVSAPYIILAKLFWSVCCIFLQNVTTQPDNTFSNHQL